jgi:hypothetical protein
MVCQAFEVHKCMFVLVEITDFFAFQKGGSRAIAMRNVEARCGMDDDETMFSCSSSSRESRRFYSSRGHLPRCRSGQEENSCRVVRQGLNFI